MPDASSPVPRRTPSRKSTFKEIGEIRDDDGLVAVITERESDGTISFCIFREFDRTGEDGKVTTERSTYLRHRHIAAAHRLLIELDKRIEAVEDRARAAKRVFACGGK